MAKNFSLSFFKLLPVPFMIASLAALMLIFKHDPLGFLLKKRTKIEAIEGLKRVYLHESDEKYEEMYK